MKTAYQILEEFRGFARDRCSLSLKNGEPHEGYPVELEDNHLVWIEGGPLAPDEDLQFPIAEIDLNSLTYWNTARKCYMDARWNEQEQRWTETPFRRPS